MRQAGMSIIAAVDIDPEAGLTYRRNFPESQFFETDIRKLEPEDLTQLVPKTQPLLISACAPCQPFTKQKTTRRDADDRVDLLDHLHRFIEALKPDFIFLENVPGLQKRVTDGGPFCRFRRFLENQGYWLDYGSPEAMRYGVPQVRRRLVMLASRRAPILLPPDTHGSRAGLPGYETVWNWISDLPQIEAGETCHIVPNHRAAALSTINLERIRSTPPGGCRAGWPDALKLKCHKDHTGHTDVYGRMVKDRPAPALSTRCISLSNGRYGHPLQDRAISVREAARLQTFPDSFIFEGTLNGMAKQIGNAVPVRMAAVFGHHILTHHQAAVGG